MTEVMNSYGHKYRITDILKVEYQIGEITPQLGLLEDSGVANTVSHFGFHTIWGHQLTLSQVIQIANKGRPVIVSFPPNRYPQGHLVVVTGGNSSSVNLADSSIYDRRTVSRAQFLKWWGGFSAVLIPNSQWK
jgi:ABC-type bacteriocin/lantibiotic exporter with double-glycine peptidase domain